MEVLKQYAGAILTSIAALVVVIFLGIVFRGMKDLVTPGEAALPLVAIGGVVVLVLLLTAVATMFSVLNLANRDQAMGLPEGSIRAVIALSLIVLFAILSVFLFQHISTGGPLVSVKGLSDTDRAQFLRDHATARDIQSTPVAVMDLEGKAVKSPDGAQKYVYDVSYRSANTPSEDFAKQLLVLLGTLMTAITSFYLGAGTVTSAVKAGGDAGAPPTPAPSPTSFKPTTYAISAGTPLPLEISGTNLNNVKEVRIKSGNLLIAGTDPKPSATRVTCNLNVATAQAGPWDIEIRDSGPNWTKVGTVTLT